MAGWVEEEAEEEEEQKEERSRLRTTCGPPQEERLQIPALL